MIVLIETNKNKYCLLVVDKFVKFKFGMYIHNKILHKKFQCYYASFSRIPILLPFFSAFHYEPKVLK